MNLLILGLWGRGILGFLLGAVAATSPAGAAPGAWTTPQPEFAALTTRWGVEHFGLIVAETSDTLTLHQLSDLKDVAVRRSDILTLTRGLGEADAFARESLGAALAWKLSTLSGRESAAGRLALVPLATEPHIDRQGLDAFQASILTTLAQRQIQVLDPGQVEKALMEAALRDPLAPPAMPLGKALNATWVLTGRVVTNGMERQVHYRLVDVATGRIIVAGAKRVPPPLGPQPTTAPAAVAVVPLPRPSGTDPQPVSTADRPDLSGPWLVYRRNSRVRVQLAREGPNRYLLKSGLSFAGVYELRGGQLVMVTAQHRPPPKIMLVWQRQPDGSFTLTTGTMAGYRLARVKENSTSADRP